MPIPRLTGPRVAQRPLAPENPNAALPALRQGIDALEDRFRKEVQYADEVAVDEAEVALQERLRTELSDPERGVLNQRGSNALDAAEDFRSRYESIAQETGTMLRNGRQREAFRQRAQRASNAVFAQVNAHAGAELRKVDSDKHTALLATDRETIARLTRIGNTAAADEQIVEMSNRIALYGSRQGADPATVTLAREQAISGARALQIQSLVDAGKVTEAMDLYAAHRDQLRGEQVKQVGDWVRAARISKAAQEAAASAIAGGARTKTAVDAALAGLEGPDATEIRAMARKIADVEIDRVREAQKLDSEDAFEEASLVMDGASPTAMVEQVLPITLRARLTADQMQTLRSRANAPAQNWADGWIEFRMMDPEERAAMSPTEFKTRYWRHFDATHRREAEALYKNSGDVDQVADIRTFQQQIDATATIAGIKPLGTAPGSNRIKAYERFVDYASRRIDEQRRIVGKRMDYAQRQAVLDQLVREQRFEDPEGRDDLAVWEIDEDSRGRVIVPYEQFQGTPFHQQLIDAYKNAAPRRSQNVAAGRETYERMAAALKLGDIARFNRILLGQEDQ